MWEVVDASGFGFTSYDRDVPFLASTGQPIGMGSTPGGRLCTQGALVALVWGKDGPWTYSLRGRLIESRGVGDVMTAVIDPILP